MIDVQIETDLDLSSLAEEYGRLLPKSLMQEIGQAYRAYRERSIWQGKQLHDGSQFAPLKPATIARKRGEVNRKTNWIDKRGRGRVLRVSGPSIAPEKPLIDTGNLSKNVEIRASDGLLIVGIGPQRAAAALGHQTGYGHLPRRVHLSWNPEFTEREIRPRVAQYYERVIREKMGRRRIG